MPYEPTDVFVDEDGFEEAGDDLGSPAFALPDTLLSVVEGRPARRVSCEQEVGGDGHYVASQLYDAGLTSEPGMRGYHSGSTEWCYVEDDGSVDGEVIYSRLHLAEVPVARRLDQALDVVHACIAEKHARLDSRCGFHVHVGLDHDARSGACCYSMGAVQSLYHLWNHVEDTVYRLGSANWRHHRDETTGNDYAAPSRKGLTGAVAVGNNLRGYRGALNFMNFLGSRGACHCGAFDFGAWQECTCELPKPTVEFRVFNGTANKRKVRAYSALALALVAYAETHECTAESHPVHAWAGTHALDGERSEETLRFILRELPLSDVEREDVRYCAERCSLADVVTGIRRRKGYREGIECAA